MEIRYLTITLYYGIFCVLMRYIYCYSAPCVYCQNQEAILICYYFCGVTVGDASGIRPYFTLIIRFVNNPWGIGKTSSVSRHGLILLLTIKVSNSLAHPQQWLVELTAGLGKAHKHIHTPITWREQQQSAEQQHTYSHSLQVAQETRLRSKCCHSHTISTNRSWYCIVFNSRYVQH